MKIEICSREKAPKLAALDLDCNIISIKDIGTLSPYFEGNRGHILALQFDDEHDHRPTGPRVGHVQAIIDFAKEINERPLICHCEAGISRSSAAAIIVYVVKFGLDGLYEKFTPLLGLIYPNWRMYEIADELLGFDGKLITECNRISNADILIKLSGGGEV